MRTALLQEEWRRSCGSTRRSRDRWNRAPDGMPRRQRRTGCGGPPSIRRMCGRDEAPYQRLPRPARPCFSIRCLTCSSRRQEHEPHHGTKKEAGAHEKAKEGGEAGLVGDRRAHVLVQNAIGLGIGKDGKDEGAVETVFEFEKDTIHTPLDRRLLSIRHGIIREAELNFCIVCLLKIFDSLLPERSYIETRAY